MIELNKVYCGDVRDLSNKLDENSINTIITSPPYWALRHYGIEPSVWDGDPSCEHEFVSYEHKVEMYDNDKRAHWQNEGVSRQSAPEVWKKIDLGYGFCKKCGAWKGTLGLEPDFKLYVKHLCDIFDGLKRPLRDDGTLWVNLGDTHYTKSGSGFHFDKIVSRQPEGRSNIHMANAIRGMGLLPTKCLVLAPFRFAIEMCNRGWTCRNVIIWQKNNVIPTSANDRFTVDFEYLFLFTQNKKYYFKQQLEPYKTPKEQQYRPNPYPDKAINKKLMNELMNKKYDSIMEESNYRQGMHSNRGNGFVEKRNLLPQKEFVDKLREAVTAEEIIDNIPIPPTTVGHWFRYDESGFSYPTRDDWKFVLEGLPDLKDLFPELINIYYETDAIGKSTMGGQGIHDGKRTRQEFFKNAGRNKRTVWNINTKPSKEAHFAVFPPELVKIPIDAGCPEFICKKCGKPRIPTFKKGKLISKRKPEKGKMAQNKDTLGNNSLRDGYEEHEKYLTYTDCGCNAGFEPGVVLDPFTGSGTTLRVARSMGKNYIGFDISEEYCKMTEKLLLKEIAWEKEDSGDNMGDMMQI